MVLKYNEVCQALLISELNGWDKVSKITLIEKLLLHLIRLNICLRTRKYFKTIAKRSIIDDK